MRPASLNHTAAFAAALLALPLAAHAAFDGDFAITDVTTPAGIYTLDSFAGATGAVTFAQWSVTFGPSLDGTSYLDTTLAPQSITFGTGTPSQEGFFESKISLIVEVPCDGFVSFNFETENASKDGLASFAVYLSGELQYILTDAHKQGGSGFQVSAGDTLEFRSATLSSGTNSFATNVTTISDFVFTVSVIPEPATAGLLLGLAAMGLTGRRRRSAEQAAV